MKKIILFFTVFTFWATILHAEVPIKESVTKLYVATFNRAPDAAGLNYWLYDSGLQLEQIAQSFFDQPETQTLYPVSTPTRDFIEAVYRNLFNRVPDTGGWDYWESELESGRVPKSVFLLAVINGAQVDDAVILENKKEIGLYFSESGLNDTLKAKDVMEGVDVSQQSVEDAKKMIDTFFLSPAFDINGTVQLLGYMAGATVSLFDLDDLVTPIGTTLTSSFMTAESAGTFAMEEIPLDEAKYYLLSVTGGKDIDVNDGEEINTSIQTDLNGTIFTLLNGKELKNGIRINVLGDMIYTKIKNILPTLSFSETKSMLNEEAGKYLFDINGDSIVNYEDVMLFNPVVDQDKTILSYRDIVNLYMPKLYDNENKNKKLSALMYLDQPEIMIENGALQEIPFTLKAMLSNAPKGLNVKWFIDNEERVNIDETISKDGIYKITAKLYDGETLLKTIDTSVIATTEEEIASVMISTDTESEIVVDTESNSSLAGTQIYIPKGALKEDTKIIVKKASVNVFPVNSSAMGITDVLVLQPSGLTFDKPIQIRLPYSENLDLRDRVIHIARYSEGKLDYITPLYIDEEKHEIVFETEHFTAFMGDTDLTGDSADEKFIERINDEFPSLDKSIEEWKPVLNIKLGEDFTVYDNVVEYFKNKNIVSLIDADNDWKGYSEAYSQLYGDAEIMSKTYERWESIKKGFAYIDTIKGFSGGLKYGLMNIVGLPKFDETLADPSSDYNKYIFQTADEIIGQFEDTIFGTQIDLYFRLRDSGLNNIEILEDLKNSIGKDYTINIGGGREADNGWIYVASFSDKLAEERPPENMWERIDTMYSIYTNFKAPKYNESLTVLTAKDVMQQILSITTAQEKENGDKIKRAYFDPYTWPDASARVEVSAGENVTYYFTIKTENYADGEFYPRFELRDRKNKIIETLIPQNYSYHSTGVNTGCFDGILNFTTPSEEGLYHYMIYFEDDKLFDLSDMNGRTYLDIHVQKQKNVATVTNLKVTGILQNNGLSYSITLTPSFDTLAHPPVDIVGTFKGRTLHQEFIILKNDFNDTALQNIPFTVSLKDMAKEAYSVEDFHTEIDIKSLIAQALKEDVQNSVTAPKLVVNGSRNIKVGETVSFSVETKNIKRIIKLNLHGHMAVSFSNDQIYYRVTFTQQGIYFPSMVVELLNGERITIRSEKIIVSEIPIDDNTNMSPMVETLQSINISSNTLTEIYLNAIDPNGDMLSTEIITEPLHGMITGRGTTLTYTPDKDYTGLDSFVYSVKDGNGGVSEEGTVNITIIEVKPAEIRWVGYSENEPKDSCLRYDESGCEETIERGETFVKEWQFKNIGNVDYSGLQVIAVSSESEFIISAIQLTDDSLPVNDTVSYKFEVSVPENARIGIHKALFKLVDVKGDLFYSNGEQVYFWYKFKIEEDTDTVPTVPQNFKATQTSEGVLLSWDPIEGATSYTTYAFTSNGTNFTLDDVPGSHFVTDTSYLFYYSLSDGDIIFFSLQTDQSELSEKIQFVWQNIENNNQTSINDLIFGTIDYRNDIGEQLDIPSDMWVRIVPSANQNDTYGWDGLICKVNSSGGFGQECYVFDETRIRELFANSNETYQIVVFKNHVDPEAHSWNCGEDVYQSAGMQEYGSWSTIAVMTANYQSRANEVCSDNSDENTGSDPEALFYPNGGEVWLKDEVYTIRWDSSKITGGYGVNIYYINQDVTDYDAYTNFNDLWADKNTDWHLLSRRAVSENSFEVTSNDFDLTFGNSFAVLVASDEGRWDISNGRVTFNLESVGEPNYQNQLISGKITDYGLFGIANYIRITPPEGQVEGIWGGIMCRVNNDDTFGDECVLHDLISVENFANAKSYEISIYTDITDNWRGTPDTFITGYTEEVSDIKNIDVNFSAESNVAGPDLTLPVTGLHASDGTYYNKIEITWDGMSGVTAGANYELYRCADTTIESCTLITRRTNTSYTEEKTDGIQANTNYYYRIRVQGIGDEVGEFSHYDIGYLDPVQPIVTEPIASQGTYGDRVHISWVHVEGASAYTVYACNTYRVFTENVLSSSECRSVVSQTAHEGDTGLIYTEADDTDVIPGVKYWYHVRARKNGTYGEFSKSSNSGYAGLNNPLIPAISIASVTTLGDTTPTFSIRLMPPGAHGAQYYKVYRCSTEQTDSCILIQDVLPYIDVYDNRIDYNANYYYRARSVSYNGNISDFSEYAVGFKAK